MKERLRELGIKTTELSEYMRISRPSLYKYVSLYESGDYGSIPEKVLRVFKYIDRHSKLTKEQVVSFTICEFSESEISDKKEAIRNYLMRSNANDPKVGLMYALVTTHQLDSIAEYLSRACIKLESADFNDSDLRQVARLVLMRSDLESMEPLSEEDEQRVRMELGE